MRFDLFQAFTSCKAVRTQKAYYSRAALQYKQLLHSLCVGGQELGGFYEHISRPTDNHKGQWSLKRFPKSILIFDRVITDALLSYATNT